VLDIGCPQPLSIMVSQFVVASHCSGLALWLSEFLVCSGLACVLYGFSVCMVSHCSGLALWLSEFLVCSGLACVLYGFSVCSGLALWLLSL
jgi:hypothetical protein